MSFAPARLAIGLWAFLTVVAGCGNGDVPQAQEARGSAATASGPAATSGAAPTTQPPSIAGPDAPRAVYYVGDTAHGPRLFRYFEPNDTGEPDHGTGRVIGLLIATPSDPDYRTLWPLGSLESLQLDGDLATVALRDVSVHDRPSSMSEVEAALAVEQVIYTVQAAAQRRVAVQFRFNGHPIDQVFGVPTSEPLAHAPQLDVLALVNIADPAEGLVVEDSFSATGVASSFEGTVPWRLEDSDGNVVRHGAAQADGWLDKLHPWRTGPIDVSDLPPGLYTFIAMTDDPSGGAEGPGPFVDTRTITVR